MTKEIINCDFSSSDLRNYLLKGGKHPAEHLPNLFSMDPPEAGLTYAWIVGFRDMFSFLNDKQLEAARSTWTIKDSLSSQTRIWIDVLFIDQVHELRCPCVSLANFSAIHNCSIGFPQRSKDIQSSMAAAESILKTAPLHIMLVSPTVMTRAWCLWELAVRKSVQKVTIPVYSKMYEYSRDLESSGHFFEGMRATTDDDLEAIRERIGSLGDVAAFNGDMKKILDEIQDKLKVDVPKPVSLAARCYCLGHLEAL